MDDWLTAARMPAVLVTVAIVEGSGPREPGARMLVTGALGSATLGTAATLGSVPTFGHDLGRASRLLDSLQCELMRPCPNVGTDPRVQLAGTVGGGHLEWRAIEIARAMLADGRARHFERFALGPGLGQCCGGVVHLAFELADPGQAALLAARARQDSWRLIALDGAPDSALFDGAGAQLAGAHAPQFTRGRGAHVMQEQDGRRWLVDPVLAPRAHLLLFGAGHVGAAIVRALGELPCTVTWVDEREDMFPSALPANVTIEATDAPEALVAVAPAGASYLVMTHSHALDLRLAEAILARTEVGWFGLIGSHTKRKQFEHRLRARGFDPARIAAMACPIGLPGVTGKQPAVIAASVCAQLLILWEEAARAAHPATGAASFRLVGSHRP